MISEYHEFPAGFEVAGFVLSWGIGVSYWVSRFLTKGMTPLLLVSQCLCGERGSKLPILPPCSGLPIVTLVSLSIFVLIQYFLN